MVFILVVPATKLNCQESAKYGVVLLESGYLGLYIPGAPALLYVPVDRCGPKWALQRAERHGYSFGMHYRSRWRRWIRYPAMMFRGWAKFRY
jgi:hypothetical protein